MQANTKVRQRTRENTPPKSCQASEIATPAPYASPNSLMEPTKACCMKSTAMSMPNNSPLKRVKCRIRSQAFAMQSTSRKPEAQQQAHAAQGRKGRPARSVNLYMKA